MLIIRRLSLLFCAIMLHLHAQTPFVVMVNPAGDARNPGRMLDDGFERGATFQCAELLKHSLMQQPTNIQVVFTRVPGETLEPLQAANFANRLKAHCYLSIHCYREQEMRPRLSVYHYQTTTNQLQQYLSDHLRFSCFDQAHLYSSTQTRLWTTCCKEVLERPEFRQLYEFLGVWGIPFSPLVGIQVPAFALEIGIKEIGDIALIVSPLTHMIQALQKNLS